MISLWLSRHWGMDIFIAVEGFDDYDGYNTYVDLGVGFSYTWSW